MDKKKRERASEYLGSVFLEAYDKRRKGGPAMSAKVFTAEEVTNLRSTRARYWSDADVCEACDTIEVLRARLAQVEAERDEARLQHEMSEGVLSMTVHRLGGRVEGRPTERVNFLQRVDALRECEEALCVVDSVLRARQALDDIPDRIGKINRAIAIAKTNDPKGEVAEALKRAEQAEVALAALRQQIPTDAEARQFVLRWLRAEGWADAAKAIEAANVLREKETT